MKHTNQMLDHIFGDRKQEFIQFLIDFRKGKNKLPILNIWSKENCTGKSTFIKWMNYFFDNSTIIFNEDLESRFNPWARKKMILIEGLDRKQVGQAILLKTCVKTNANRKYAQSADIETNFTVVATSHESMSTKQVLDFEIKPLSKNLIDRDFDIKLKREEFAFEEYLQTIENEQ